MNDVSFHYSPKRLRGRSFFFSFEISSIALENKSAVQM
jgi:hypothetical protein